MARRENETFYATIKSPKLFIGDICYALNDDTYQKCWGDALDFQDGLIPVVAGTDIIAAVTVSTAYGDGSYTDEKGNEFGVDAGNIGVTGSAYFGEDRSDIEGLGVFVNVPSGKAKVEVEYDEGMIRIDVYDAESRQNLYDGYIQTSEEEEEDYEDDFDPWAEEEDDYEDEDEEY